MRNTNQVQFTPKGPDEVALAGSNITLGCELQVSPQNQSCDFTEDCIDITWIVATASTMEANGIESKQYSGGTVTVSEVISVESLTTSDTGGYNCQIFSGGSSNARVFGLFVVGQ